MSSKYRLDSHAGNILCSDYENLCVNVLYKVWWLLFCCSIELKQNFAKQGIMHETVTKVINTLKSLCQR